MLLAPRGSDIFCSHPHNAEKGSNDFYPACTTPRDPDSGAALQKPEGDVRHTLSILHTVSGRAPQTNT